MNAFRNMDIGGVYFYCLYLGIIMNSIICHTNIETGYEDSSEAMK